MISTSEGRVRNGMAGDWESAGGRPGCLWLVKCDGKGPVPSVVAFAAADPAGSSSSNCPNFTRNGKELRVTGTQINFSKGASV